jgi:hypothetical protein
VASARRPRRHLLTRPDPPARPPCPARARLRRSVVIGLSVERLTQDKVRWHPDDIANIQSIANT